MALPSNYGIEKNRNSMAGLSAYKNGGPGSGNFGHAGRPGKRGGSGKGGAVSPTGKSELEQSSQASARAETAKELLTSEDFTMEEKMQIVDEWDSEPIDDKFYSASERATMKAIRDVADKARAIKEKVGPEKYGDNYEKAEDATVYWSHSKDGEYKIAYEFRKDKEGKYRLSDEDWSFVGQWMPKKKFDSLKELMTAEDEASRRQTMEKRKAIYR